MNQQSPPPLEIPIQRLPHGQGLPLPTAQSAHAAGLDVVAAVPEAEPMVIEPGAIGLVPLGFAIAVPVGYEAQVRPRSGLATKHGISMPNTPGTVDADYRGEMFVPLINHGREAFTVTRRMRVAQMLIKPVPPVRLFEVDELPATDRGAGGFGSTGH
ncbi:MAG: dUTP diphosphatase [Planctomycetota bacterium]